MRLIKRRSTPVIEHDPLPASVSLIDLGGPGVASTSTTLSTPPLLHQRHSNLDVRLPYRLSHSHTPPASTPQLSYPKVENHPGTDCSDADTHTSRSGKWNVLTATAKGDEQDSLRSGDVSPRGGSNETIPGNKRESGGQNRYPPNSLVPGNGWGFGLMRRSRKQDMTIVPPLPLRMDSLSWQRAQGVGVASTTPVMRSTPITPVPAFPPASMSTPHINLTAPRSPPISYHQRPAYLISHSQPLIRSSISSSSQFSPYDDHLETLLPRSDSSSSLSRSISLSETTASGGSTVPLIQRHRRRSASLAIPRLRRDSLTRRKLQKRRGGSTDSTSWSHLPDVPPLPPHAYAMSPAGRAQGQIHGHGTTRSHFGSEPNVRKEYQGVHTTPPNLPEGAEAAFVSASIWSLARQSSTSTNASSMIAPSTDESTVLTPPYDPGRDQISNDKWDALNIHNIESDLSRSSTLSFSQIPNDVKPPSTELIGFQQMLFEASDPSDANGVGGRQPHSGEVSLRSPSLATMRSVSDTTVSFRTALGTAQTTTPELHSLSSGLTSRPGSRTRHREGEIDFTRPPIHLASSSTSLDSPAQTGSSTSSFRSFGPSRWRRGQGQGHIRSRASSLSAISINNRASSYSVGEVIVADHGAMTPAMVIPLPNLTPSPHPDTEEVLQLPAVPKFDLATPVPSPRPGTKRSQSDLSGLTAKVIHPFRSRESLNGAPRLVPPPRLNRLHSVPSLEIITSPITVEPDQVTSPLANSASFARTSSLGRLWRRISVGRKKSKRDSLNENGSVNGNGSEIGNGNGNGILDPQKSRSCVDVTPRGNLLDSPISFRAPLGEIIPEVPNPGPRSSSLVAAQAQAQIKYRNQLRTSDLSFASSGTGTGTGTASSTSTSFDLHLPGRKPIGPRMSSLSTPPSVVVSDHSGSYFPHGLTGASLPRAAEAPSTSTIHEDVAFTSTPDAVGQSEEAPDYIARPPSSPRTAATVTRRQKPRFSVGSGPAPTAEERRRYRQTLVDIQDDVVFHQVLQDLARLDQQGSEQSEGSAGSDSDQPSPQVWKADKGEIRAWFVTREMVQGERRHGRLLARGVAAVQAAAESRRDEVPPLPTSMGTSQSTTSLHVLPAKQSFLSRRNASSRTSTSMTNSSSSSSASTTNIPSLSLSTAISPKSRSKPLPPPPASCTTSPLDLLLERLPRLLALSLTLSSRFEDDLSPHGVAEAFIKMESEMIREFGLWAGEVGNLVAMGMGDMLDTNGFGRGRASSSRRSISGDAPEEEEHQEDKLGFADIIIMPIQRAARYKLLFQEMMAMTDTNGTKQHHDPIMKAHISAERLAAECDRRQVFDLHAIRRQITPSPPQNKKTKKRPRSLGGVHVHNVNHVKETSWTSVPARGVGVAEA